MQAIQVWCYMMPFSGLIHQSICRILHFVQTLIILLGLPYRHTGEHCESPANIDQTSYSFFRHLTRFILAIQLYTLVYHQQNSGKSFHIGNISYQYVLSKNIIYVVPGQIFVVIHSLFTYEKYFKLT